jgi:hypothetical protein
LLSGVTLLEVLVAFSLLTSVLSLSVPLAVRHGRLLTSARHYRLALAELTNQLERLTALPPEDVEQAATAVSVSEFTAAHLPGAELSGAIQSADLGRRITLSIVWDEPQRRAAPLKLTAWAPPAASAAPGTVEDNADLEEPSP